MFPAASLGVVLGSGLDAAVKGFRADAVLPFDKVEGLSGPTAPGHRGEFRRCDVGGRPCIFVCGRKHFYEGARGEITVLMRFLYSVGVRRLVLTSAAGSLTRSVAPGEFVLVTDIMDAQYRRPAARQGEETGERSGRGGLTIDSELSRALWAAAARVRVGLGRGAALTAAGPMYETPAEIRAFQEAGAAVVTMSGAPELAEASRLGMRVAMVAVVTNWASGISSVCLRHEDVLEVGRHASRRLRQLIVEFATTDRD